MNLINVTVTELRGIDSKNAVDSILRIIDTEEGSTTMRNKLKTIETLHKQTSHNRI